MRVRYLNWFTEASRKRQTHRQKIEAELYDLAAQQMAGIDKIGLPAMKSALADSQIYIQSLYQAHLASDSRGLTFGSFLTTAGTALFIYPLVPSDNLPTSRLLMISSLSGLLLFCCGVACFSSVWPKKFCLPGTDPTGWLPGSWFKDDDFSEKNIFVERLTSIHYQVTRNRLIAAKKAKTQKIALAVSIVGTGFFGLLARFGC